MFYSSHILVVCGALLTQAMAHPPPSDSSSAPQSAVQSSGQSSGLSPYDAFSKVAAACCSNSSLSSVITAYYNAQHLQDECPGYNYSEVRSWLEAAGVAPTPDPALQLNTTASPVAQMGPQLSESETKLAIACYTDIADNISGDYLNGFWLQWSCPGYTADEVRVWINGTKNATGAPALTASEIANASMVGSARVFGTPLVKIPSS
ncbi:MAG: hypothetical protein M1838_000218 [Thelocarpon superellum]|nr:MAG: hypothetical protein M1838_000218 [Thelocarpon superellum]